MSLERFRQCLTAMKLPAADAKWFPKWVHGYAAFPMVRRRTESDGRIPVQLDQVIGTRGR